MPINLQNQAAGAGAVFFLPDDRVFQFDVTTTEEPRRSSLVTEHPSQNGVPVSDNVRRNLRTLGLSCVLTDTPFNANENTPEARAQGLYQELIEIQESGTLLTVVTALEVLESMVIESMSAPYSTGQGDSIAVALQLKERRIANSLSVDAPSIVLPRNNRGTNTEDQGTQQGNEPRERASLLFRGNSYVSETQGINIAQELGRLAR